MFFAVPMVWHDQTDHATDYYFCLTNIKGFSRKIKLKIVYRNCNYAIKAVPYRNDLLFLHPLYLKKYLIESEEFQSEHKTTSSEARESKGGTEGCSTLIN